MNLPKTDIQSEMSATTGTIDFDQVRLVLFDLDGTLVDSVGDLAWCGNEMLRSLQMPLHDPQAARRWVGNGLERFVKRVLTGDMEAEPGETLFPGVIETLDYLAGLDLQLACVTNKPEPFTSGLIKAMGLAGYFGLVVAGDTTAKKKPDPMPLHYAADHFLIPYAQCLMVGDSSNDVQAARAAGFSIACVPYGYNHGHDIRDSNPDLVVENLTQLNEMFA
jgi:phosphoglycolate phosphatase